LYLAKSFETAETLCRGLTEDGYLVKVIQMGTDTEFELFEGRLCPVRETSSDNATGDASNENGRPSNARRSDQGPSDHGVSPAFA
jgi:hypothetical protein